MRSPQELATALSLLREGLTPTEISRSTGIPRSTVRDWGYGSIPRMEASARYCQGHDFEAIDPVAYAYLLGMYLGDGCISVYRRWTRLRITCDAHYTGIIEECAAAIRAIAPGKPPTTTRRRHSRAVDVSKYWSHWPCLIPQHGPPPKHGRRIRLDEWQRHMVDSEPHRFLRGLIHSDGCRIIATERKGSYVRRAPRYAFTNASEDILSLFGEACDAVDVHWTRAGSRQIAVYSKDSVARLDAFVGPKA